jgi:hypothetical protein
VKKFLSVLILGLLVVSTSSASAVTQVKVTPQFKVNKKNPIVTIKVAGLPLDHGIYISQCMAPKKSGDAPTACNPSAASKLWISSVVADQKMGAKSGTSKLTMKLDKYFDKGDCVHTTCVLFVTSDHNASDDRTEDQAIKFKFDGLLPF